MSNQDLRPSQPENTTGDHSSVPDPSVDESPYLVFTRVGTHWHGRRSLQNLFVFGDSYSSRLSGVWGADEDSLCDVDDDDATWVDFLQSSLSSPTSAGVLKKFAFPGATVEYDLDGQLARFFNKLSNSKEPGDGTLVFFLGINDCGGLPGEDLSSLVEILFDAIRRLYVDANARNFILVDVPPTDRSPAASGATMDITSRIKEWNASLVTHVSDFVANNTEVTMQVFSSHKVLSEILDDPGAHGFAEKARDVVGRGIWRDILHLTRAVHKIISSHLLSALGFD